MQWRLFIHILLRHLAVYPGGTTVDNPLNLSLSGSLQDIDCPSDIDALSIVRIVIDILDVRYSSQMEDRLHPAHGHIEGLVVEQTALIKLDVLPECWHNHVEYPDFDALVPQLVHHMRTDKT